MENSGFINKLCSLVGSTDIETKRAAIKILGEMNYTNDTIKETLEKTLLDSDKNVQLCALESICKLGLTSAIPKVMELVYQDEFLMKRSTRYLGLMGKNILEYLETNFENADARRKKFFLNILGEVNDPSAIGFMYKLIFSDDKEISTMAVEKLQDRLIKMDDGEAKIALKIDLVKALKKISRKVLLGDNEYTKGIALLKISKLILGADEINILARFLKPRYALISLLAANIIVKILLSNFQDGRTKLSGKIGKISCEKLLLQVLYLIAEMGNFVGPELDELILALEKIPTTKESQAILKEMLKAKNSRLVKLAAESLAKEASKDNINCLLNLLGDENYQFKDIIINSLKKHPTLVNMLLDNINKIKNINVIRDLGAIIKSYNTIWVKKDYDSFISRCLRLLSQLVSCKNTEKIELLETLINFYIDLFIPLKPEMIREAVLGEAMKLKKSKKIEEVATYLKFLQKEQLATPDVSYELAVVKLAQMKIDIFDIDTTLTYPLYVFSELLKIPKFKLINRIKSEKDLLKPEHFYYIAMYFLGKDVLERAFAREILEFLSNSLSSKSKLFKLVKEKLKRPL